MPLTQRDAANEASHADLGDVVSKNRSYAILDFQIGKAEERAHEDLSHYGIAEWPLCHVGQGPS